MYQVAIIIHAASALLASIFGVLLLFQRITKKQLFLASGLLISLFMMEIFLTVAIYYHWDGLDYVTKIAFSGLGVLGIYMLWRGFQAMQAIKSKKNDSRLRVTDHVGFILISLFDGFSIVAALDLNAPGWLVGIIAVGAILVGIQAINIRKKHLV